MDGESINTYERVDSWSSGGTRKTEYFMGSTVYDSAEDVARALFNVAFMDGFTNEFRFKRVSLYRVNGQDVLNMKESELEAAVRGKPSIHVDRDGSRVVNASGDGDDLLRIQKQYHAMLLRREAAAPVTA